MRSAPIIKIDTVQYPDGCKEWYRNGKPHRDYGPAVEMADGSRYWYRNGLVHRDDGPAVELANGSRYWYRNGSQVAAPKPGDDTQDGDNPLKAANLWLTGIRSALERPAHAIGKLNEDSAAIGWLLFVAGSLSSQFARSSKHYAVRGDLSADRLACTCQQWRFSAA